MPLPSQSLPVRAPSHWSPERQQRFYDEQIEREIAESEQTIRLYRLMTLSACGLFAVLVGFMAWALWLR